MSPETFALLLLLLTAAALVARSRDLFTAIILLGVFSLLQASLFITVNAPDVALTEAAVGAGISTLLLLAATASCGHVTAYRPSRRLLALASTGGMAALLLNATLDMPFLGDQMAAAHRHVARSYLENTLADTGVPNAVTSVLASYRGFDTLGELAVIFTAGVGVLALLRRSEPRA